MKRISNALLSLGICLLMIGCATKPAPLEITKAWTVEKVDYIVDSFVQAKASQYPKDAHRFVAIEIESKSDAETKFDVKDLVMKDSTGGSFTPIGTSSSDMSTFHRFPKSEKGGVFFSLGDKGAKGVLVYEVPSGSTGFQLAISGYNPLPVALQ